MTSGNSTNGFLIGVIYADSSEDVRKISPFKHWMAIGICNAFFLFGRLLNNEPIKFLRVLSKRKHSSSVSKRFGRHDTISRKSRRMPLLYRPTGTPLARSNDRLTLTSGAMLEMPMGAVSL